MYRNFKYAEADLWEFAREYGLSGYRPYNLVYQSDGKSFSEKELISFPFVEDGEIFIMAREFENPTTMRSVPIASLQLKNSEG